MDRVITIVPDENNLSSFAEVLSRLRSCRGIGEYLVLVHTTSGNDRLRALADQIDFAKTTVVTHPGTSLPQAHYLAWEHGFQLSDFIIHVDGQTLPARDCLKLFEFCRKNYQDNREIFSVTAFNDADAPRCDILKLNRRHRYTPRLAGLWKTRWNWVKTQWTSQNNSLMDYLGSRVAEHQLQEVYPLLSRGLPTGSQDEAESARLRWSDDFFSESIDYVDANPQVTAVMITGMHPSRYLLARVAVRCFQDQSYPNKELLIINHGTESLATDDPRVVELRIQKKPWDTVGDLRNLGIKYASGDFIISWDDDDWHHPKRIEVQMGAREGDAAVFLRKRIHYSLLNQCARYVEFPKGALATILHPRNVEFRYPSLVRNSDTVFAHQFKTRIAIDNDAGLYVRFYHGMNLWPAFHIMGHLADAGQANQLRLRPEHKKLLLREILPLYKHWAPSVPEG